MKTKLHLAPERRLAMTFALQQAVQILQMPQGELAEWLTAEIEGNPLLELTSPPSSPPFSEPPAPPQLHASLETQVREHFSSDEERRLAHLLLEELDEKGFLTTPLSELSLKLQTPLSLLERVVATLQTFDPPGLCARSLQEALLLQLKALGEESTPAYRLLATCFDDLLHRRYSAIRKKLGLEELSPLFRKLSRLTFRPLDALSQEVARWALPDLELSKKGGEWVAEASEEGLPSFQFHKSYLSLTPTSPSERETLRGWEGAARWLLRSLNRRKKLLQEVGALLAKKQRRYLDQTGPLAPLSLKDLSRELSLHESTLSRIIAGKFALTPRGLLPLRSLLSSFPSSEEAKELLMKTIEQEEKKSPFTDEELVQELSKKGVIVARRTVAKYRKELKLGSAKERQL